MANNKQSQNRLPTMLPFYGDNKLKAEQLATYSRRNRNGALIMMTMSVLPSLVRPQNVQDMDNMKKWKKVLFLWFLPVTEEILKTKAKHLGDSIGVADFQYSNGWL